MRIEWNQFFNNYKKIDFKLMWVILKANFGNVFARNIVKEWTAASTCLHMHA